MPMDPLIHHVVFLVEVEKLGAEGFVKRLRVDCLVEIPEHETPAEARRATASSILGVSRVVAVVVISSRDRSLTTVPCWTSVNEQAMACQA